jgi:putative spermidine/putrescine transport system substrate-binding protein
VSCPSNRNLRAFSRRLTACTTLALAMAAGVPSVLGADDTTLKIATWGGAYGQSQEVAYFEPFAKETGIRIATEIYDGSLAKARQMIGTGESPIDVIDASSLTLSTLCKDGLLEPIDAGSLGLVAAADDFHAGGLSVCGVASVAWSTAIVYDRQAFAKERPSKIADLLDTKRFPGKRALPASARRTLELVMLADGVEPANVYTELATPEGIDRAFAALDRIKSDVFLWDDPQEPITWLLEKHVVLAAGYTGRVFRAAVGDKRIGIIFDGQVYDLDLWAIPKAAKNKYAASRFIAFASEPARIAKQAELTAYGPMRKSAIDLVGKHPVIGADMKPFLPTAPENFQKALRFDEAWWNANGAEIEKRFAAWNASVVAEAAAREAAEKAKEDERKAKEQAAQPKAAP